LTYPNKKGLIFNLF